MTATTEDMRVTCVWGYSAGFATFSGVPLAKGSPLVRTGKVVVFVKTRPDILPMEPRVGQHWRITGAVDRRQAVHGDFKITEHHYVHPSRCEITLPDDGEGFIRFIAAESDFKGIGEKKARELWSSFGRDIYAILERKDAAALSGRLTEPSIAALFEGYERYANLRHSAWLAEHEIPPHIQCRLFKLHGKESIEAIQANPYALITFGQGFAKVDELALRRFRVRKDDKRRLVAAVEDALRRYAAAGGHTLALKQDLERRVLALLRDPDLSERALAEARSALVVATHEGSEAYHHTELLIMEKVVARRLRKLADEPPVFGAAQTAAMAEAETDLPYALTARQRDAVKGALAHRVSCITGGAGTGKTTVLRTVLHAYAKLGYAIKAMALSGRAAMRLRESAGLPTSTIAKFLRDKPIDTDSQTILVIDEASLVDIATMYRIVNHTDPSVRLLFVGDPNQLPPIGPGLVLADVVRAGVIATTELDVVQRQAATTGIPEYARMIRDGIVPPSLGQGSVHFHDTPLERVAEVATALYGEAPAESQILVATREMNRAINTRCQGLLNADGETLAFTWLGDRYVTDLRRGDPVLFTKNDYEAGVQNGSLGRLVSIDQTETHFGAVHLDTGDTIELTKSLLDSLLPGYSITLHKAQGSQFPRVIVCLAKTPMIDRAWLYTAVTRAQVGLHIVGTADRMSRAVLSLSAHHMRKTHLHRLLEDVVSVAAPCQTT